MKPSASSMQQAGASRARGCSQSRRKPCAGRMPAVQGMQVVGQPSSPAPDNRRANRAAPTTSPCQCGVEDEGVRESLPLQLRGPWESTPKCPASARIDVRQVHDGTVDMIADALHTWLTVALKP